MKAKLIIVFGIILTSTYFSYGSSEKLKTREDYEKIVKQQQAKIEVLEKNVSEQKRQILDLEWQIYHLKHETEPNEIEQRKDETTKAEKQQPIVTELWSEIKRLEKVCRNAGIDPNSEPNNIKKLMTEEKQKAYQERLANYREQSKKKPTIKRSRKRLDFKVIERKMLNNALILSIVTSKSLDKLSQSELRGIASELVKKNSDEYMVRVFFYNQGEVPTKDMPLCRFEWTEVQGLKLSYDNR